MRKFVGASVAALLAGAAVTSAVWSQGTPKTCSEAYSGCKSQTGLAAECEAEKTWCMKTGTFAHPKTRAVTSGLHKK